MKPGSFHSKQHFYATAMSSVQMGTNRTWNVLGYRAAGPFHLQGLNSSVFVVQVGFTDSNPAWKILFSSKRGVTSGVSKPRPGGRLWSVDWVCAAPNSRLRMTHWHWDFIFLSGWNYYQHNNAEKICVSVTKLL